MNGARLLKWGKGRIKGQAGPKGVCWGQLLKCVWGIRSSTSKSDPRDMKHPGKAYAAVSRQGDKLGLGGRLGAAVATGGCTPPSLRPASS